MILRSSRAVLAALAAVTLACVAVPTEASARSTASSSHRVPVDNSFLDGVTLDGICAFPITFEIVRSREYVVKERTLADGTLVQRITGSLVESITNANTSKSVTVNVGGPATVVISPEGIVTVHFQGHGIAILRPSEQANTGQPGLVYSTGSGTTVYSASGEVASFTAHGRVVYLCDQLA